MTDGVVVVGEATDDLVRQELWPLSSAVFRDFYDLETWRDQVWDRHAARAIPKSRRG